MGRLNNKMAFVTGGAQGLGEAIAHMFAKEGAKVAVTDVNGDGAAATAEAINASMGEATAFAWQHDVTDEARWQAVLAEAHEAMGGLNVLVNNAGI
ncbi:MAG: SDR family NAD(P)-dependent oxidoreductase, partial [Pseudomonadota bacterium]